MERLIKRYQNRKLYDTKDSRYVTMKDVEEMVRHESDRNETIKIIDSKTKEDLTRQIFMQIILQHEKHDTAEPMPLDMLKNIVTQSQESMFQFISKTIEKGKDFAGKAQKEIPRFSFQSNQNESESVQKTLDKLGDWLSKMLNDRLRRRMLHIPTREDWMRIDEKLKQIENKTNNLIDE